MPPRRRKRIDASAFNLPVDHLRQGASIDRSAARVRQILIAEGRSPLVTIQIAAERACILGGTDEAIALLKACVEDWAGGAVVVSSLYDGERVEAGETVMTVSGPYERFAHLEPLLLGILAFRRAYRMALVASAAGLGFALYLAHIESAVLGVWCIYCVISLGVISLLSLLTLGRVIGSVILRSRKMI